MDPSIRLWSVLVFLAVGCAGYGFYVSFQPPDTAVLFDGQGEGMKDDGTEIASDEVIMGRGGVQINSKQVLMYSVMMGVAVCGIAIWFLGSILPAVFAGIAAGFGGHRAMINQYTRGYRNAFNDQLADACSRIGNALRAGATLPQALRNVANMPSPAGREFQATLDALDLGRSPAQALEGIALRTGSQEMQMMVTAVKTTQRTGGELSKMLERVEEMVRGRVRQNAKLRAETASVRLQAQMVAIIGFLMLFGLKFLMPDYLNETLDSIDGQFVVMACMGVMIYGWRYMQHIGTDLT